MAKFLLLSLLLLLCNVSPNVTHNELLNLFVSSLLSMLLYFNTSLPCSYTRNGCCGGGEDSGEEGCGACDRVTLTTGIVYASSDECEVEYVREVRRPLTVFVTFIGVT